MSDKKNLGHNRKKDFLNKPVEHIDITSFDTQQEKINAMNFNLGNGFVSSQDNTIKYKESVGGALQELSITYDGNGGATGIFTHEVFWDETWANSANNPTNTGGFGGQPGIMLLLLKLSMVVCI